MNELHKFDKISQKANPHIKGSCDVAKAKLELESKCCCKCCHVHERKFDNSIKNFIDYYILTVNPNEVYLVCCKLLEEYESVKSRKLFNS